MIPLFYRRQAVLYTIVSNWNSVFHIDPPAGRGGYHPAEVLRKLLEIRRLQASMSPAAEARPDQDPSAGAQKLSIYSAGYRP